MIQSFDHKKFKVSSELYTYHHDIDIIKINNQSIQSTWPSEHMTIYCVIDHYQMNHCEL